MFDFSKIPILNFLFFENFFGNLSFFCLFCALIYFWIKIIFFQKEPFFLENPSLLYPEGGSAAPSHPKGPYPYEVSRGWGKRPLVSAPFFITPYKEGSVKMFYDLQSGGPFGSEGKNLLQLSAFYGNGLRQKSPSFLRYPSLLRKTRGHFLILVANISLSILLVLRWINSGHFPLSNLYESLIFLSWSCTTIHLILVQAASRDKTFAKKLSLTFVNKTFQENIIGSLLSPLALLLNAYASFNLPKEMQQAAPLVPALQSNWLMMHVTVMILSYACLLFGSLLSIAFLIITAKFLAVKNSPTPLSSKGQLCRPFGGRSKELVPEPPYEFSPPPSLLRNTHNPFSFPTVPFLPYQQSSPTYFVRQGTGAKAKKEFPNKGQELLVFSVNNKKNKLEEIDSETYSFSKASNKWNNIIDNLDNYSYRIIGIGFCFLTIGILSGAVWANEAWGSYWSWDPKETWAFLTWLVYAIYLHTRFMKGWNGQKPAFIASFGFLTVWICFLGVNLIGKGLHSYGFWTN